jgi:hypothetical protein
MRNQLIECIQFEPNEILRSDSACNFLEGSSLIGGRDTKIIYRVCVALLARSLSPSSYPFNIK